MKCIYCCSQTRVTDKRESPEGTRRRRECYKCRKRFTTYERAEKKDIMVVKKDGARERFSLDKLKSGVMKACEKRPISTNKIDKMIENIEERLRRKGKEVKSQDIGKMVVMKLKKLDKEFEKKVELPEGMISGYYKYIVFEPIEHSTGKVYDEPCHHIMRYDVNLPNTDWVAKNHWCVPIYYNN